jgi:hypothetical protein
LVKTGANPKFVYRFGFARLLRGKTGTYLITALPPRAAVGVGVDAVQCTAVRCPLSVVKAALLRSQPCAMPLRARPVALAPSNLIFTMRRRSHKANCLRAVQSAPPFPPCCAAPGAAVGQGVGWGPQGSLPDPAPLGPICKRSRSHDVKPTLLPNPQSYKS